MSDRGHYLLQSDIALLNTWAGDVRAMFRPAGAESVLGVPTPYLVGSAMTKQDYRDVDVRLMLPAVQHDQLLAFVDIDHLNLAVSLWGQKATGLPIDFQVQQMESANEDYGSQPRSALGFTRARATADAR